MKTILAFLLLTLVGCGRVWDVGQCVTSAGIKDEWAVDHAWKIEKVGESHYLARLWDDQKGWYQTTKAVEKYVLEFQQPIKCPK